MASCYYYAALYFCGSGRVLVETCLAEEPFNGKGTGGDVTVSGTI